MGTSLKASGKMIKQMDKEHTFIKMVPSMRGNGKMTYKTDLGKKAGQIKAIMKVIIQMEKSMAKVNTFGWMDRNMMENGIQIQ